MIDWHSHILHGIDDGAPDLETSLRMAAVLAEAGFTTVYCTPHFMAGCYEVSNDRVRQGVLELQHELDTLGIPLTLLAGREYYLDEFITTTLKDPLPLGDSKLVLVEIPPTMTVDMVRQLMFGIVRSGFTPVIAHPERCNLLEPAPRATRRGGLFNTLGKLFKGERGSMNRDIQSGTSGNQLLDYLRDLGCFFQGNLGSFSGFYGQRVAASAEALRHIGIYDRYGSDLHSPDHAGIILKSAPLAAR